LTQAVDAAATAEDGSSLALQLAAAHAEASQLRARAAEAERALSAANNVGTPSVLWTHNIIHTVRA